MVFSSTVFLFLFLPLVLLIYYNPIFGTRNFKNIFLLLASLLFYAWGEPVYVALMCVSIVVTYILGLLVEKEKYKKYALCVGIGYHILVLFVFKYMSFVVMQLSILLFDVGWEVSIALPIGISFFSFQSMSYLWDIYYGKTQAQKSAINVGLYIALFPQLIAGPIVRYVDIVEEITNRVETKPLLLEGCERFIWGLGKKVLLANYLAQIADNVFLLSAKQSVMTAWLGAMVYSLQIYFDFLGYSDMAIGLGKMFGFHFPENFNYPYIAGSVTEFWRRWHISLGSWFRDYVYIPLGGNRVTKSRWIFNLFAVWGLTGIWHGANWTFLAWGFFYFIVLLVEKITGLPQRNKVISRIYTPVVVMVAWVIFRADSITAGIRYIGNMFGIRANGFCDSVFVHFLGGGCVIILLALICAFPVAQYFKQKCKNVVMQRMEAIVLLVVFVLSIIVTVSETYNPFIYFNF